MLWIVINSPPQSSQGKPAGDLGLIHRIKVKVPPFLGVTVVSVGVVTAVVLVTVVVAAGVVVELALQPSMNEEQIKRIATMMKSFFTVLPPENILPGSLYEWSCFGIY